MDFSSIYYAFTGLVILRGYYKCWYEIGSFVLRKLSGRETDEIIGAFFVIGSVLIFAVFCLFLQQGVRQVYKSLSEAFIRNNDNNSFYYYFIGNIWTNQTLP